ncbi:MAG: hypothetical protein EA396_03900 [Anaerolineaceae bacterium]|nr:MAG: hypothetical protein EA396_03900 [Anaerolineaceae bacterium]
MNGDPQAKIDRLIDAIELVKINQREAARAVLREIIRIDNDFEEAWLWMAVVVDTLDQSAVCLDNVLRVNPNNVQAAGALYRLREKEILMEFRRERLRARRNVALGLMWLMVVFLLNAMWMTMLLFHPASVMGA